MKLRRLGTTDLQVSPLCLGTMQFGWTADEDDSFATLDAFLEAGGNFVDTADIYSSWAPEHRGGEAEELIGRWMTTRHSRDRIVVATKARGRMWDGPDGEGLSRAHLMRAAEDSLRRMQTDVIDLYQCHWPDEGAGIEETVRAFEELIAAGKVRYIGASNYTAGQLDEARRAAGTQLPHFVSLQPHYNLVHRAEYEPELEGFCVRERIGVIPYSPLAGGFLTGKYRAGQELPKTPRRRAAKEYMNERGFRVLDALDAVAGAHETSPAAVALAWLLTRPAMTAPIIGANTPAQLADLLPAAELSLSAEEVRSLDEASA
jgi:aryl-alcohol dehydrogenase-like predicted oxidoreductase